MKTLPATASFADFARIARFKRSYVAELKASGRLVLTDDGRAVRVQESLQRIDDTRDPSKAGVVARHAVARAAAAVKASAAVAADPGGDGADDDDDGADTAPDAKPAAPVDHVGGQYQQARAEKERYLAMAAKRDYEVSIGKLLDAGGVEGAAASALSTLRQRLEAMAAVLAPQLAPISDEQRVRAVLAEAMEHALAELSREFSALART